MTTPPYSDEQYKNLKRKVDRYSFPSTWLVYGIQQTDKTSLRIYTTFGLREVPKGRRVCKEGYSLTLLTRDGQIGNQAGRTAISLAYHDLLHCVHTLRIFIQLYVLVHDGSKPLLLQLIFFF